MQQTLVLHSRADLEVLLADPGNFREVRVVLPEAAPSENDRLSHRLTDLAAECDYGSGGVGALLALATTLPVITWLWYFGPLPLGVAVGLLILLTSLSALVGRLISLALARKRLRREVEGLRAAL